MGTSARAQRSCNQLLLAGDFCRHGTIETSRESSGIFSKQAACDRISRLLAHTISTEQCGRSTQPSRPSSIRTLLTVTGTKASHDWKPYISEVYQTAVAPHQLVIAIVVPIQDQVGKPVGILMAPYTLETMSRHLVET